MNLISPPQEKTNSLIMSIYINIRMRDKNKQKLNKSFNLYVEIMMYLMDSNDLPYIISLN